MQNFSYDDISACICIILSAGADRDNFTSLEDLWNTADFWLFCQAVMSCQRFKFFLRVVRFDKLRDQVFRLQADRLAAISEVLIDNLKKHYCCVEHLDLTHIY